MEVVIKGVQLVGAELDLQIGGPSRFRSGTRIRSGAAISSHNLASDENRVSACAPIPLRPKGPGRYILDLASAHPMCCKEGGLVKGKRDHRKIAISFYHQQDEKVMGRIEVDVSPGRGTRSRGWKRLAVRLVYLDSTEGSGHSSRDTHDKKRDRRFSAYRLMGSNLPGDPSQRTDTILIFARVDTANFLSLLPDNTPLGDITLPGTHESCALYGFPISQCQQPSTRILQQLSDGVRFLDVRLRVVGDELLMYHGPRPQRSSLPVLLEVLHSFLDAHPGETLILSIKEEIPPFHPHFSARVWAAFQPHSARWFLEERIPKLGEVRGKGLLLTRFDRDKDGNGGWEKGMSVHPSRWPDSREEGFDWDCAGATFRIQDWYRVHTFLQIPEKFQAIISHLEPTLRPLPNTFTLSYTSASFFPLSLPTTIAKGFGFPSWGLGVEGINARLTRYLLWHIVENRRIRACIASDFYRQGGGDDGPAGLLVLMNTLERNGA